MKIGIDISQAVYQGTGVARFTEGLTRAILKDPGVHTWTFFYYHFRRNLPQPLLQDIQKSNHKLVVVPLPPKTMSYIWNDLHTLSISTLIPGLDWFITSDWTEPPAKCKKATIVHDLAFKRFPETIDETIMSVFQKKLELVKNESRVVFADSKATQIDLIQLYHMPENKIVINYPGVELPPTSVTLAELQKKFGFSKPYVLTVGKLEPRKNLKRLFEAYKLLGDVPFELLVVGQKGWGDIPAPVPGIKMVGYVSDTELTALYKNGLGLIFPSLWEGFGYPAVEAMLAGIPTALSNRGSLEEIGNDASFFFNPEDTNSIKEALQVLANPDPLRTQLIKKGRKKALTFNWDSYLKTFIQALEQHS